MWRLIHSFRKLHGWCYIWHLQTKRIIHFCYAKKNDTPSYNRIIEPILARINLSPYIINNNKITMKRYMGMYFMFIHSTTILLVVNITELRITNIYFGLLKTQSSAIRFENMSISRSWSIPRDMKKMKFPKTVSQQLINFYFDSIIIIFISIHFHNNEHQNSREYTSIRSTRV